MATFNPQILNSLTALRGYFNGQRECSEIVSEVQHRKLSIYEEHRSRWKWQVGIVYLSAEMQAIFAQVIRYVVAPVLKMGGATLLATQCEVLSAHLSDPIHKLQKIEQLRERFLAPIKPAHQLCTSDLYLHSPLPFTEISDRKVVDISFATEGRRAISFYHPYGACHGVANWFLYLYYKTRSQFSDPEAHMIALSKQFDGIPRQAALLHSLRLVEPFLLDMPLRENVIAISGKSIEEGKKLLIEKLKTLPPHAEFGIILSLRHRINLIKIDDQLGFIVDPAHGVIELRGNLNQQLAEYIADWMKEKSPTAFDVRFDYYFYDPEHRFFSPDL